MGSGIHLSEPSPQRTPVIYQAGASPRGIRFAARNAEAIFIGSPTTVADTLESIVEETGIDGFNLAYAITPGDLCRGD